jgi:hypothetical protein
MTALLTRHETAIPLENRDLMCFTPSPAERDKKKKVTKGKTKNNSPSRNKAGSTTKALGEGCGDVEGDARGKRMGMLQWF